MTNFLDKEFLLQQLVFEFQNLGVCKQFSNFALFSASVDFPATDLYQPLPPNHRVFSLIESFLTLCDHANTSVDAQLAFLKEAFSAQDAVFKHSLELQSAITCILLPSAIRNSLRPLFEAVLCLLLDLCESAAADFNIFSSVLPSHLNDCTRVFVDKVESAVHNYRWFSFDAIICPIILDYAKSALTHRIRTLCCDNYSEQLLDAVIDYKNKVMCSLWLSKALSDKASQSLMRRQLSDELIYQLFYDARKPDIFSLIIEFPDSMGALVDLGKCVERISLRQSLITHLSEGVSQRLLHPGVHTEQILVAYSYLVRALRIVDKSHLVQDVVCRPVALCLRQREDAVRCIVDKLLSNPEHDNDDDDTKLDETAGVSGELYSELLLRKPLEVEPVDGGEDSDSEFVFEDPAYDDVNFEDEIIPGALPGWGSSWQPDPIEAIHQGGQWRRRMDLLSLLVSIYGSKKAFLVEYKQLLSQRLLKQRSFQIANDLRNLELLKLRFGDQNLAECEVMLKDIRDSKRIASLVAETNRLPVPNLQSSSSDAPTKSEILAKLRPRRTAEQSVNQAAVDKTESAVNSGSNSELFPLSAFVLSLQYWPELLDEKFKLPTGLQGTFDSYERVFQRLKGNRTLQWMHKLGLVNIELQLGDRCVQVDVTPLQASIIHLFTKKPTWSVRDLAQELETQISAVRSSLQAFIQLGFLRNRTSTSRESSVGLDPHGDIFEVNLNAASNGAVEPSKSSVSSNADSWLFAKHSGQEEEEFVCSTRDKKQKELQMFWSYIVAMLTNLGGLSLDRIHSMLRMFALGSTSSLDFSRDELRQFLEKKMNNSEIVYDGEVYRLPRADV